MIVSLDSWSSPGMSIPAEINIQKMQIDEKTIIPANTEMLVETVGAYQMLD